MSGGHGHDDHGHSSGGSGKSLDIGVTSMIAGFFGAVSGAGAVKQYMEGGGGGHDDHGHH